MAAEINQDSLEAQQALASELADSTLTYDQFANKMYDTFGKSERTDCMIGLEKKYVDDPNFTEDNYKSGYKQCLAKSDAAQFHISATANTAITVGLIVLVVGVIIFLWWLSKNQKR